MTDEQKILIARLRFAGKTYAAIGKELGIKENTVKTHCNRHDLTVLNTQQRETDQTGLCKNCGQLLSYVSGKKKKTFCSDKCRNTWWSKNRILRQDRAFYQCICAFCGKEFYSYGNKNRKYCGRICYFKDRCGDDKRTV